MNFKTTIVLIVLLIVLGGVVFFTRDKGGKDTSSETTESKTTSDRALFADVKTEDITKLTVKPSDGQPITLEKANAAWSLKQPVQAPAETFEVDSLVRSIAELKSHGTLGQTSENDKSTGLAAP